MRWCWRKSRPVPEPFATGADAVTYRISTYYKRPRSQPGLTSAASTRISLMEAIDWLVSDLPDEAITWSWEGESPDDKLTFVIDWSKVPDAVRAPKIPMKNGRRL